MREQYGKLQGSRCIKTGFFCLVTAAALCGIYLPSHACQCDEPLGEPEKHTAHADSCDRFGTEHTNPGHICDVVGSAEKRRRHNRQGKPGKRRKDRTGSQIERFCFIHHISVPNTFFLLLPQANLTGVPKQIRHSLQGRCRTSLLYAGIIRKAIL